MDVISLCEHWNAWQAGRTMVVGGAAARLLALLRVLSGLAIYSFRTTGPVRDNRPPPTPGGGGPCPPPAAPTPGPASSAARSAPGRQRRGSAPPPGPPHTPHHRP